MNMKKRETLGEKAVSRTPYFRTFSIFHFDFFSQIVYLFSIYDQNKQKVRFYYYLFSEFKILLTIVFLRKKEPAFHIQNTA
jgi:hypothetical protein